MAIPVENSFNEQLGFPVRINGYLRVLLPNGDFLRNPVRGTGG